MDKRFARYTLYKINARYDHHARDFPAVLNVLFARRLKPHHSSFLSTGEWVACVDDCRPDIRLRTSRQISVTQYSLRTTDLSFQGKNTDQCNEFPLVKPTMFFFFFPFKSFLSKWNCKMISSNHTEKKPSISLFQLEGKKKKSPKERLIMQKGGSMRSGWHYFKFIYSSNLRGMTQEPVGIIKLTRDDSISKDESDCDEPRPWAHYLRHTHERHLEI